MAVTHAANVEVSPDGIHVHSGPESRAQERGFENCPKEGREPFQ
jgi:hypothetical protein